MNCVPAPSFERPGPALPARVMALLAVFTALAACAGEPKAPPMTKTAIDDLQGRVWVLEDIGGKGIIDRSRADATFAPDGKVYGRATCNRFTGSWKRTRDGVSISIGPLATTMMACPPALMNQEQKFLGILAGERRLNFQPDGSLLLGDGAQSALFRAETGAPPQ